MFISIRYYRFKSGYFQEGNESTTRTEYTVLRSMGDHGDVKVVWGIFSDAGANLPRMRDLLFLGNVPASVTSQPSRRRLGTQTTVLYFDGSSGM